MIDLLCPLIDDDNPEPVEVLEILVECDENCYLPQQVYTTTIIDDQGAYSYHAYHLILLCTHLP